MNLFNFLKSTRGAIKPLNALIISGAMGAVFAYTVSNVADRQVENERQVRMLSSISASNPQAGMLQHEGRLTSINVGDGRGQLATAEERAAMQGNQALDRYMANQRALEGMDSALGRAAQFSESDGLNTGNRDVSQVAGQFVQGTSVDTGEGVAGAVTRAGTKPQDAGETGGRPSLAPASITRASGGNSGSSAGAVSGGIVGGPGSGAGRSEGTQLSGAMPGGSNIMSQRGLDKGPLGSAGTSAFRGGRDGYITRGPKAGRGKNELDDIAKRSARAAASNNPSANEGAQAFLASATRGGVVVTGGESENEGGNSSEDLKNPTSRHLRAVGNHLQKVDNRLAERNRAHRKLINRLLITLAISLGAMAAGMIILSKFAHKNIWYWVISAMLLGIVATANYLLFQAAHSFIHEYGKDGGTGMAWFAKILAPFMVAGMGYVILQPTNALEAVKQLWKGIVNSVKTMFKPINVAMSSLGNTVKNALFGSIFK